jgi:4-carboxymuconolactone decarboxylase
LSELAICVTGRFWSAHYEWYVHAPLAIKAGISEDIITAIRENRQPSFVEEDEQLVHDISLVLHRDHRIPDDLYRRGTEVLGTKAMVDLVGLLGYYTLISMTLNAFDVQLPGDAVSDL